MPFSRLFKEAASYETRPMQNLRDYCFQKLCKLRKLDDIPDDAIARTVRLVQQDDPNALYAFMKPSVTCCHEGR